MCVCVRARVYPWLQTHTHDTHATPTRMHMLARQNRWMCDLVECKTIMINGERERERDQNSTTTKTYRRADTMREPCTLSATTLLASPGADQAACQWLFHPTSAVISVFLCIHVCAYIYTYTCMHTDIYAYVHIYVYTYVHIYIYTCTCTHTQTHTHTLSLSLSCHINGNLGCEQGCVCVCLCVCVCARARTCVVGRRRSRFDLHL